MEDIRLQYQMRAISNAANYRQTPPVIQSDSPKPQSEFQTVLKAQLQENSGVSFSKHAVKRAIENNIALSDDSLSRLGEGVRLAGEKNLEDTLILVGRTAFLVNVKNNMVITTVNSDEMKGNVFTNIDGTVIV